MNSWQQPNNNEPGGATWHRVADPGTGWFALKTSWSGTDNFSSHGWTVDFSSVVPNGTKAAIITGLITTAAGEVYWRPYNDSNISNTPNASGERSSRLLYAPTRPFEIPQSMLFLSTDYKVEITLTNVNMDLYISYPIAYLL